MTIDEKFKLFIETIEAEEPEKITKDSVLEDMSEWDSMGMISVIAMLATEFGRTLTFDDLKRLKTVGDILAIMEPAK